ncbi:MAG: pantoate--beta-alanine ligase [Bacillota bacterium]
MKIIKTIAEMKEYSAEVRAAGKVLGFVPTMGYLHEGHLTLMRESGKKCDVTVASIFVNPLQFGQGEDYEEYPRDLTRDAALAEKAGVAAVFAPTAAEMYPRGYNTFVDVAGVTGPLCGWSRPGHFRGVTTVVNKLFNIVQPHFAFFGQKDAQQVLVIRKMAVDLNMNLEIVVVPIVREADGLAMSSRNVYLDPAARQAATVLFRSLAKARELVEHGERDPEAVKQAVKDIITGEPLAKIDYVELLSMPDLTATSRLTGQNLLALAVFIGKTRLIDNAVLEV